MAFTALKVSFPGSFQGDIDQPVMSPMLDFLKQTGS
jgi:hypothetical protein